MKSVLTAVAVAIQAGLPVALRGKPGVGKTSMIEAIARELNLHLEVVIGSLREPTDLAGLPIVQSDGTVHLAPPKWAVNATESKTGALVLLDELTTASPSVQAAMLRVIRERVVGDLQMNKAVRIVAAYNDARDCGGYELELPMRSRLLHINVSADPDVFIDGILNGWNPPIVQLDQQKVPEARSANARLVAGFLRVRPSLVEAIPTEYSSGGYPCPRTWEMVIDALTASDQSGVDEEEVRFILVSGCIGEGYANEFLAWTTALDLPDPKEILRQPEKLREHLAMQRPDRTFVILATAVDVAIEIDKPAAWQAGIKVLAVAVDEGYGDIVAFLGRKMVQARPSNASLPPEMSRITQFITSI
jgi:hypothetical protein